MTTQWSHFSNPLQSNADGPSERSLREWLKISAPDARRLKDAIRSAHSGASVDRALDLADKMMEASGVESIEGEHWVNSYYGNIVALYVNTGDTYNATLLYEPDRNRFHVTTFGDWVEKNERKYSIR